MEPNIVTNKEPTICDIAQDISKILETTTNMLNGLYNRVTGTQTPDPVLESPTCLIDAMCIIRTQALDIEQFVEQLSAKL
jgi:hypothetical protein